MRRGLILLVVGLNLTGCRALDRDRDGRGSTELPSRTKPRPNDNWLDGPVASRGGTTDRGGKGSDAKDPNFDVARETRGVLAGFVEDTEGRKAKDVSIEVDLADGSSGSGAPIEVQTDRQGYFMIRGLNAKQTYVLTARTKLEGRDLSGRVYAQTGTERSQLIRIPLLDGLNFPAISTGPRSDLPDHPRPNIPGSPRPFSPPDVAIPPSVAPGNSPQSNRGNSGMGSSNRDLPMPRGLSDIGDRDWSPTGFPNAAPTVPTLPPVNNPRPELMTDGPPNTLRPPAANIPPNRTQSQSIPIRPNSEFVLMDTLGVTREFPSGRAGELVLLDFMTTSCLPCQKAIPTLKDLQSKYGTRGLEVIGVTCNEASPDQRRAVASTYQRTHHLNYLLYVEPGAEPGKVMRRFGVESYPSLVLINGSGAVLWKGHPADVSELESIIQDELRTSKR